MRAAAAWSTRRWRTAAGAGVSIAVHGLLVWLMEQEPPPAPVRAEEPAVEIALVETPREPEPEPEPERPRRRSRRTDVPLPTSPARGRAGEEVGPASSSARGRAGEEVGASSPTGGSAGDLLRMRGGPIGLSPSDDTLARALGPVEAPPAVERPRRKPRLPGTGLTTLEPEIDQKVRLIHPRFYEVLGRTEKLFRPDAIRMADEVRGELAAGKSIKRWLFGSLGGDPEALRNQVPTLACLVCVTLRPNARPEIELAGASGSPWFDRAATESVERASVQQRPDEAFDPARACYRFAAKAWRTRPDLTNLAIPFKLNFSSWVRLVSYEKLGG